MIQQTVARLLALAPAGRLWVITNDDLGDAIAKQLPRLNRRQILAEPVGRNTAPAIGLGAFLLLRTDPTAVIGLFPSDHVIRDEQRYRETITRAIEIAEAAAGLGAVERAEVAGPGFVNVFLRDEWFASALGEMLGDGDDFGAGGATEPEAGASFIAFSFERSLKLAV